MKPSVAWIGSSSSRNALRPNAIPLRVEPGNCLRIVRVGTEHTTTIEEPPAPDARRLPELPL